LPGTFIPSTRLETAKLFNGFSIRSSVTTSEGESAAIERRLPEAYELDLEVKIQVPKAASSLEELEVASPLIGANLPGLKEMLPAAKISDFYHGLYRLKVDAVGRNVGRLDELLSRHNFFDCNTILEISDPRSARKALLIQADMDVNADGSDADRYADIDGSPTFYQPFTSYRWAKKTEKPNQFLAGKEAKLRELQSDFDAKATPPERKKVLKEQIDQLRREISDLKKYSFLVSKMDPFVVLPGFMLRQANHPFLPRLGDYVLVIYGGKFYPAIVGDVGPSYKMGEGSIRLCAQLDPNSTAYHRPVSDLSVTYLVFPGSADQPFGPPDVKKMRQRCESLLNEIGGYGGELWEWDQVSSPASPSPTSTPLGEGSATPSGTPPSPTASPSPAASPARKGA
jgi:hypothetical protein